uniref:Uncharacterized protein n=1 Tax=Rhizophora mucronata TaxID=61149 RepID=A0A2P2QEV7_RHIMU
MIRKLSPITCFSIKICSYFGMMPLCFCSTLTLCDGLCSSVA